MAMLNNQMVIVIVTQPLLTIIMVICSIFGNTDNIGDINRLNSYIYIYNSDFYDQG